MRERKFITETVKKLLVSEYIRKETESAGFGNMVMKRTPFGTNITLHVNKPGLVIGRRGSKIQEITENLERLFNVESPQIEVKEAENPDLNPQVVSKKIALSLEKGWSYRKAGNTSLRRAVDNDVRGIMIKVSGKLTGERSRTQKFFHGSVKYSGEPGRAAMLNGFSIAKMKQGVIGVTVRILDPDYRLPDEITFAMEKLHGGVETTVEPEPEAKEREEVTEKPAEEVKAQVRPEPEKPAPPEKPEQEKPEKVKPPAREKTEEKPGKEDVKPEAEEKKPPAEEKAEEEKPEPEKAPAKPRAKKEKDEKKAEPEEKPKPEPKKRGRKPKKEETKEESKEGESGGKEAEKPKPEPKKRGRKPKKEEPAEEKTEDQKPELTEKSEKNSEETDGAESEENKGNE